MEDVAKLVAMMKDEWGVLSLTDLVFNHTANESPWLQEHPECSYNMVNSPHLKPAYLVDRILWHFSMDVAADKYADQGVPAELRSENHLQVIPVITVVWRCWVDASKGVRPVKMPRQFPDFWGPAGGRQTRTICRCPA